MRAGSRISHTYDYDRDHILIFFPSLILLPDPLQI